jgi:hypothetical protein
MRSVPFWLIYLLSLALCFSSIEVAKASWGEPEPTLAPESAARVFAIPPRPDGVRPVLGAGEGDEVRYSAEKCAGLSGQYRDICYHQLARQRASTDLQGGRAACDEVAKVASRWECMADIAELYAPFDREASLALCPDIRRKKWRDQCVFGIALALSGKDPPWAFRACDQAGQWRDFCRHDVNGEIAVVDLPLALKHCAAEEGDILTRKTCWHGIGKYIARVDVPAAFAACAQVPPGPGRIYRENCFHGLGWGASEGEGSAFSQQCGLAGDEKDSCILGVAYNLRRFDPEAGIELCAQVGRSELRSQCLRFVGGG